MMGVLDWGIGGLFAVERLLRRESTVDIMVLADSGSVPYGRQSRAELTHTVRQGIAFLQAHGATQVLVACHSASSVLPDVDLAGVQGVVAPDCVPKGGRFLVLGGERTVRSGVWRRALRDHGTVVQRVAQPLSAAVEAGQIDGAETRALLAHVLGPIGVVDTVVLACTHYVALATEIQHLLPEARIVDPALGVADRLPVSSGSGRVIAWTTGDAAATNAVVARVLPGLAERVRFGGVGGR
jgi:glutamate racemase